MGEHRTDDDELRPGHYVGDACDLGAELEHEHRFGTAFTPGTFECDTCGWTAHVLRSEGYAGRLCIHPTEGEPFEVDDWEGVRDRG